MLAVLRCFVSVTGTEDDREIVIEGESVVRDAFADVHPLLAEVICPLDGDESEDLGDVEFTA